MKKIKKETAKSNKVTYEDIEDIVEFFVRTKSHNYSFGSWTHEDIAQEIRLICFQKLDKLDTTTSKEKWKNFFGTCVDNALKNLKRDNYLRACPYGDIDKMTKTELKKFKKSEDYEKWKNFQKSIQKKIKVLHPVSLEMLGDTINSDKFQTEMEYKDMEQHVVGLISPELKESFKKMLRGEKESVPNGQKRKIKIFMNNLFS